MKSSFSTHWQSSKQPRKQRKYIYNAPLHTKQKFLSAHLSKELRKQYGKRNFPVRKGDEVLVMRGAFRKKRAKVTAVEHKTSKIILENIQRAKRDGTKSNVRFSPHILQIVSLNLDDRKRLESINRKSGSTKQTEKKNAPTKS